MITGQFWQILFFKRWEQARHFIYIPNELCRNRRNFSNIWNINYLIKKQGFTAQFYAPAPGAKAEYCKGVIKHICGCSARASSVPASTGLALVEHHCSQLSNSPHCQEVERWVGAWGKVGRRHSWLGGGGGMVRMRHSKEDAGREEVGLAVPVPPDQEQASQHK